MPTLKEADHVAWAIAHARKADVERIAVRVGVPEGKVRSWRHGTLNLADWVVNEIATVLNLNDATRDQHRQHRRRHRDDEQAARDERDAVEPHARSLTARHAPPHRGTPEGRLKGPGPRVPAGVSDFAKSRFPDREAP